MENLNEAKYFKGETIIDIVDHPHVWKWFKNLANHESTQAGFIRLFLDDNTERFKRLYGSKPDWIGSSEEEEWTHGWTRTLPTSGLKWMILTGPKGTIYRIQVFATPEEFCNHVAIGIGIKKELEDLMNNLLRNE